MLCPNGVICVRPCVWLARCVSAVWPTAALRASPKPGCRSCSVRRIAARTPSLRSVGGLRPIRARTRSLRACFPLVRAMHSNPLRSRARRFESCRGHRSRHKFEHLNDLDAPKPWVCDLRLRNGAIMFAPVRSPNGRPFCPDRRLRAGHSRMSTTLCHQHQGVDVQAHQQPDVRDAVLGRSRLGPVLVVARTPAIKPSVVTTYLIAAR